MFLISACITVFDIGLCDLSLRSVKEMLRKFHVLVVVYRLDL